MYHVTDPLLSLRVCYNLLKPGGILLIETEGAKGKELTLNYQGKTNKGNNWYSPTTSTMQQMLEDMGFEMSSASEADILTYTAPGAQFGEQRRPSSPPRRTCARRLCCSTAPS